MPGGVAAQSWDQANNLHNWRQFIFPLCSHRRKIQTMLAQDATKYCMIFACLMRA